ncbi:MAG: nucleoside triphosphate pyrophosphohydrolase [Gammaproteobacteria bacterium]
MSVDGSEQPTLDLLLEIMARLRDRETGCPWDIQQDFRTIAPYTLEEAYEVVDAIERNNPADLQDELGDLLFQVVFHAQLADEAGWFDFSGVVTGICEKMIRRHPHVFGDEVIADADAQTHAWENHKQQERGSAGSVLDGVPLALPALTRAVKLGKKAARVGFDWPDINGVFAKVREELDELHAEIQRDAAPGVVAAEAGDLLFAAVNILRHAGIDPESALRLTNEKFTRRFHEVERLCGEAGGEVATTAPEILDSYWTQAKKQVG